MKAARIAGLSRLDAPAAKPVMLRSRPVRAAQHPPALRCRQRTIGQQDGHRPEPPVNVASDRLKNSMLWFSSI